VELTAVDIAASIASGATSAVEVVGAHLERILGDEDLNAYTHVDPDDALGRAHRLDTTRAQGRPAGPLEGVPIALKDLLDHEGRTTTCGSSFYRHRATSTAMCVRRLETAGAVIVGRTGLHEFAFGFSSENHWFGPVRNPWDPATSPGGSSGGSGVAVAAGHAPIGIGTDTGGSVRVPSAMCGTVGLKVTHGRIPLSGVFPLAPSLDTVGPLTRTVADAELAYEVMAGHDPADPWSTPEVVEPRLPTASIDGLRIGIPTPWTDRPLGPDVRDGFDRALRAIGDAGAEIAPVFDPIVTPPGMINEAAYAEVAAVHRIWWDQGPERYGPIVADRLAVAMRSTVDDYARALAWRAGLRNAMQRMLLDADVLVTPTAAVTRKVIGEDEVATEAGPEEYRRALSWFTALVNHAGLPALALPIAGSADGPPASLQLIGRAGAERRLLAVGRALEEAGIVGFRSPPTRG
jgi:aspartyl-tRNA(Asn)/glutamyl-tRNA(Gln) amidotransferase subunit A